MGIVDDIVGETVNLSPPSVQRVPWGIICLLLDCILFGIGTIIAGIINDRISTIIIGVLQLVIPFVGWLWSIIWGVLIFVKSR